VERPRIPAFSTRKGRRRALEEMPMHEGMRRGQALRGDRKELNENLAPLRRYLEGQVGRPWDKVYSEISVRLRSDNIVQQHVRSHVHDFVAVKPRRVHGWRNVGGRNLWWQPLYVNPVTGLLCRTDQLPEQKARRRAQGKKQAIQALRIPLADDRELRRIRGIWYEVRLAPLPEARYQSYLEVQKRRLKPYESRSPVVEVDVIVRRLTTPAVRDVVTNTMIDAGPLTDDPTAWRTYRRRYPYPHYAIAKRVLSHRELRRHGISNLASE
jgi:hypothetical protein